MKKVLILKHVARENLGNMKPLLRKQGFRIRYVNFERDPKATANVEKYSGLIVLGGHMGAYESDRYPHLRVEFEMIEKALKKNVPILGICLGAQMLATVLGSSVKKHTKKEMGWCDLWPTKMAATDPLFQHFNQVEKVFQMHGDTFEIPSGAHHLAESKDCLAQAFRYGSNAYGIQFHLETNGQMIKDFLAIEKNRSDVEEFLGEGSLDNLQKDTKLYMPRSLALSEGMFQGFIHLFGFEDRELSRGKKHEGPHG